MDVNKAFWRNTVIGLHNPSLKFLYKITLPLLPSMKSTRYFQYFQTTSRGSPSAVMSLQTPIDLLGQTFTSDIVEKQTTIFFILFAAYLNHI